MHSVCSSRVEKVITNTFHVLVAYSFLLSTIPIDYDRNQYIRDTLKRKKRKPFECKIRPIEKCNVTARFTCQISCYRSQNPVTIKYTQSDQENDTAKRSSERYRARSQFSMRAHKSEKWRIVNTRAYSQGITVTPGPGRRYDFSMTHCERL